MGFLGGGDQFGFLKNKNPYTSGSINPFSPKNSSSSSFAPFGFSSKVGNLVGNNPADFMMKNNPFEQQKKGNFLSRFIDNMPKFGTDKEGKSFLDRFQEGYSYRPKQQSGQEQFYGELAKRMGARGGFSGLAQPVAEGLTIKDDEEGSPIVAPGTPGSPGLLQTVGVPLLGAFICDVKAKEDIAPLCTSEVNDVLSECAYFVKDLNECS